MDFSSKSSKKIHLQVDGTINPFHQFTSQFELRSTGYFEEAAWHQVQSRTVNDFVFIYCIKGSGNIQFNKIDTTLKQDECILIPPKLTHKYASDSNTPWSIYWFHCYGELCHFYLNYYEEKSAYIRHKPFQQNTINDFNELFHILSHKTNALHQMQASSIALKILSQSIQNKLIQHPFKELLNWFENHLEHPFDSEMCCKLTGFKKHSLFRKFKTYFQTTPLEYFTQLKINKACMLLENSRLNISEIGRQVGFDDSYYFSRVFKKNKGLSPQIYRNQLGEILK